MNSLLIESPIQTKEKFAESSGQSVRAVEDLVKKGVLPIVKLGERKTFINVAAYANQLLNQNPDKKGLNS